MDRQENKNLSQMVKLWAERSTLSSSINFHTKHNVVDTVEWGHWKPSKSQHISDCGEVIDFLDGTGTK